MAKSQLVERDYELAMKLLKSLDALKAKVRTAFWWYTGDTGEWKLVLAMPEVDKRGTKYAYDLVGEALVHANIKDVFLRDISIQSPSDDTVRSISKFFHIKGMPTPIHITNSASGNIFIEDAYVFRST